MSKISKVEIQKEKKDEISFQALSVFGQCVIVRSLPEYEAFRRKREEGLFSFYLFPNVQPLGKPDIRASYNRQ